VVRHGPWWCLGAKEALGVVRLLYSDTLRVRLCRLGPAFPSWTFWSLLGGEGGWLQGLTRGPRSPKPLEAKGKLCLLVSRLGRDPIGGAVGRAVPRERR
jgi:hypothetical protein